MAFSIPPTEGNPGARFSAASSQYPKNPSSELSPEVSALVRGFAGKYLFLRRNKIEALALDLRLIAEDLERALTDVKANYEQYTLSKKSQERAELKAIIEEKISALFGRHPPTFGLDSALISNIDFESTSLDDFIFYSERTINIFINKSLYKQKTMETLNSHTNEIIRELMPHLVSVELEDISFSFPDFESLGPEGQETHHGGQFPVLIEIWHKGVQSGKFFFKPRDAHIDKNVIHIFKKINALPQEHKSGNKKNLPTYNILNFPEGVSVWEFVEGKRLREYTKKGKEDHTKTLYSAGRYAQKLIDEAKEKDKSKFKELQETLNRMDAILTPMYCSDLHGENVLISGINTSAPQFVPVDLENIQKQTTPHSQLHAHPESVPLTAEEKKCIEEFHETESIFPSRYILIKTGQLAGFISIHTNFEKLIKVIKNTIAQDNFIFVDNTKLQESVLFDMMNGDVPYFTQCGGCLYYGQLTDRVLVGTPSL